MYSPLATRLNTSFEEVVEKVIGTSFSTYSQAFSSANSSPMTASIVCSWR